jgi:putative transposase
VQLALRHYNHGRPHRALDLEPPEPTAAVAALRATCRALTTVRRRDLLGDLIHEYELAA